jgi:hypothetical protein
MVLVRALRGSVLDGSALYKLGVGWISRHSDRPIKVRITRVLDLLHSNQKALISAADVSAIKNLDLACTSRMNGKVFGEQKMRLLLLLIAWLLKFDGTTFHQSSLPAGEDDDIVDAIRHLQRIAPTVAVCPACVAPFGFEPVGLVALPSCVSCPQEMQRSPPKPALAPRALGLPSSAVSPSAGVRLRL